MQANRGSPSATVGRAEKLAELRTLIARHARPDVTTAIDGVLLSTADKVEEPHPSSSGTVMALIVQGSKRLAVGDRVAGATTNANGALTLRAMRFDGVLPGVLAVEVPTT